MLVGVVTCLDRRMAKHFEANFNALALEVVARQPDKTAL